MLNVNALLARSNVDNFKNRDYREFKVSLEQKILDASQKGQEFVFVSIPPEVDTNRMIDEIKESGFDVTLDNIGEYKISWANPVVNEKQI